MKKHLAGLSALLIFYEAGLILWLWLGHPPSWIQTHFYPLAWWPLVILAETLAQLFWRQSLLWERPRSFLVLSLVSIPFWTGFEIINVAIKNWIYIGLPPSQWTRWLGYSISYASVLPAIWAFLDIQNSHLFFSTQYASRQRRGSPEAARSTHNEHFSRGLLLASFTLGLAELSLCLAWPQIFYPLAWGFLFFLTEPFVILKNPEKSYLVAWSQKSFALTLKTIAAGLACGIVWEFLNWKATAKWVYTLPAEASFLKIFEMPLLGFLGFGAFALCAQSFANALFAWREGARPFSKGTVFVIGLLISAVGFSLIDTCRWTR